MKRLLAPMLTVALAAGTAIALSPADAAGGCGRGFHPGPHGRCFPNGRGPGFGPGGPLVIGQMYPGRGYWDGHRYWHNRRQDHGGWRYY